MATTKIWPIRDSLKRVLDYAENPDKTGYLDLRRVLEYAEDGSKTYVDDEFVDCYFISGVNCNVETAFEEMTAVKQRYGKMDGNQAYHAYQSFKPGEVSAQLCHELGLRLANGLWGDRFQVIVTTHIDKHHLHNHLIINSVSFLDGKKFNDNKAAYRRMREYSDFICGCHDLSVIRNPGTAAARPLHTAEKNGEPTRYNLMREAIDRAMAQGCLEMRDLHHALQEQGYVLNISETRKYATIRSIHSERAVRLYRLGEDYDLPGLERRLDENYARMWQDYRFIPYRPVRQRPPVARPVAMRGSFSRAPKIGGLRALYLHYCYLLGILPKNSDRRPLSPEMRAEVRKLDKYAREFHLINTHRLDSEQAVRDFISAREQELQALVVQRKATSNRMRYLSDEAYRAELAKRDMMTMQIKTLRKEITTARGILDGLAEKRRILDIERRMQPKPQKQRTRMERSWGAR